MKNRILIVGLVLMALSLSVFSFNNRNELPPVKLTQEEPCINVAEVDQMEEPLAEFAFDFGPRFAPIKKGELERANSLGDFLHNEPIESILTYKSVKVIIVEERPTNIVEIGFNEKLTAGQKKLLGSSDISTSFSIRADYMVLNKTTGKLEAKWFNPYLTIVPEIQAVYSPGKDAFLAYLYDYSEEGRSIVKAGDNVRPGRLFFTITKNGNISNVHIGNHSGFPSLDKKMIELIENMPGEWVPAQNVKGEKVDQELVLSFGLYDDC